MYVLYALYHYDIQTYMLAITYMATLKVVLLSS